MSPEQQAFLARKASGSRGSGTAANGAADLSMSASSLSNDGMRPMEELLASLEATIQACVADGLITQQEAASCSPEQLEFLVRKRTGAPLAPAADNRAVSAAAD
jgi:hypothetical protein